ncbi:hypothetical protein BGX26_004917 [Mortierella sp. AD094]|nr:hypothetical protein BGX26_004917 [Mortierella sp. AD094]
MAIQGKVVEVYDRSRSRDSFAEQFGRVGNSARVTSAPSGRGAYKKIEAHLLQGRNSVAFTSLGTAVMNAIFTTTTSLNVAGSASDQSNMPSGLSSTSGFKALPATRVFLHRESIIAAKLHQDRRLSDEFALVNQFRAIRSQFDDVSAYFSARAASPELQLPGRMPATIFTLADFPCSPPIRRTSQLFKQIGEDMFSDPENATIKRRQVARIQASGKLGDKVSVLLTLFGDKNELPIESNDELSTALQDITATLTSALSRANKNVL